MLYTLCSEASAYLTDILSPVNEVEREDWVDRILESLQKQNCKWFCQCEKHFNIFVPVKT